MTTNPIACLLVIGNEVLSGRTQDANIKFLATKLGENRHPAREVRVIPDVPETIIATVNEVRAKFDHVFTTGGIGPPPTTSPANASPPPSACPGKKHPEAWRRMAEAYANAKGGPTEFNVARQRMATMRARHPDRQHRFRRPGLHHRHVHVMAGVPRIMQSMFETLAPRLAGGPPIISRAVHALGLPKAPSPRASPPCRRGTRNSILAATHSTAPPATASQSSQKATDPIDAEAAIAEVTQMMTRPGATPSRANPPPPRHEEKKAVLF